LHAGSDAYPGFFGGGKIMRNRMKRIVHKYSVATMIIGLSLALPMPSLHPVPSAAVQAVRTQPDFVPSLQGESAIDQLKQQGLYDSLQKSVEATRYEIRREAHPAKGFLSSTYHASSPAQQLDACFTSDGTRFTPSRAIHKAIESSGKRSFQQLRGE